MWESLLATALGALIAGGAMLLNSHVSAGLARKREDQAALIQGRKERVKHLSEVYEEALHLLDRLIRNKGAGTEAELERFYRLEVVLRLHSTPAVRRGFSAVRSAIVDMASSLPPLPEEFIPKFEEDEHRRLRLEERKAAERERDDVAKEALPEVMKRYHELSQLMQKHLKEVSGEGEAAV